MEPLVLVGYRVLPPLGAALTLSSCLVDAVPDDDTWFPSASSAAEHPALPPLTWHPAAVGHSGSCCVTAGAGAPRVP